MEVKGSAEGLAGGQVTVQKTALTVGKNFHMAEASFPRRADLLLAGPFGRGRENFRPSRGTGDFKQNPRCARQGTTNRNQGSPSTDVERGGKFKKILAFFVPAADKDGDGKWQAWPPSAFLFKPVTNQGAPLRGR